jgi:hypothetical protein
MIKNIKVHKLKKYKSWILNLTDLDLTIKTYYMIRIKILK